MRLSTPTTYRLAARAASSAPNEAMQQAAHRRSRASSIRSTLLGRWIDRAQGRDDAELEREARQREVQARARGLVGRRRHATGRGRATPATPAHERPAAHGRDLLDYGELYALWERQNWKAHELDFSVDREHWLATPSEAQEHTIWSLGSLLHRRGAGDGRPGAVPAGRAERRDRDLPRHAARGRGPPRRFFDRFGAEVMALERGRPARAHARARGD